MTYLTIAILSTSVGRMRNLFDSHAVIQDLMTHHPQDYVRELYENVQSADPIWATHFAIGRALEQIPGIEKDVRVSSVNVRGQVTQNQQWRKLQSGGQDTELSRAGNP